ncbi:MAG TPA: ABC transporter permease [Peptococcaceae bacterium]|nr:ABC transporter permease [Peptococcaceae bacterium]
MKLGQSFRLGINGITSNKLRSFLTMLGIIIGVAAVIVLVSLATGTTSSITESISSMGSNLLTVNIMGRGNIGTLTEDEMEEWKLIDGVEKIAPIVSGSAEVKAGTASATASLIGSSADYLDMNQLILAQGRTVADMDVESRQRVAVIGSEIAETLYEGENPIGQNIKIAGSNFTVIGVLQSEGSTSTGSSDTRLIMPYTTAQRLLRNGTIRQVSVQVATAEQVESVKTALENLLYEKYQDEDLYNIFDQTEILETLEETTATMSLLVGGIAGISLIVGGIGIMNIMLVSVTERTREIGIRKAIGAKKRHILTQFLVEAVVLSCTGGLIGIALGITITKIVGVLAPSLSGAVSIPVVILSFGFSLAIGILFGVYPANQAAGLNPIEALRYQ